MARKTGWVTQMDRWTDINYRLMDGQMENVLEWIDK